MMEKKREAVRKAMVSEVSEMLAKLTNMEVGSMIVEEDGREPVVMSREEFESSGWHLPVPNKRLKADEYEAAIKQIIESSEMVSPALLANHLGITDKQALAALRRMGAGMGLEEFKSKYAGPYWKVSAQEELSQKDPLPEESAEAKPPAKNSGRKKSRSSATA